MEKDQKQNVKTPTRQPGLGGMSVSPFDWEGGKTMKPPLSTSTADPNAKTLPLDRKTYGWHPQDQMGPYAHLTLENGGYDIGLGLMNHSLPIGLDMELMAANLAQGTTGEGANIGSWIKGDATMADMYYGKEKAAGIGMTVFSAGFEKSFDWENGFALEAQATVIGLQGHLGDFKKESKIDSRLGLGVSYGPGAGMRGYWGDSNKDGYREYGFGGDVGIWSFDFQTEDPLAVFAPNLGVIAHSMGLNLTELTGNTAKTAAKWSADKLKMGGNWMLEKNRQADKFIDDAASAAYGKGKDLASKGGEFAKLAANKVAEKTSSVASAVGIGAKELFASGKEKAKDLVGGGKNMVSNVVAAVKAAPAEIMQKAKLAPAAIVNTAKKAVAATKAAPANIAEKAKQAPAAIANAGKQAVAAGTNLAKNAYNGGKQAVGSIWNAAKGFGSWLGGGNQQAGKQK
jgi:hypothetical protein